MQAAADELAPVRRVGRAVLPRVAGHPLVGRLTVRPSYRVLAGILLVALAVAAVGYVALHRSDKAVQQANETQRDVTTVRRDATTAKRKAVANDRKVRKVGKTA